MKAVILAAGRGRRFGEITRTTPKCLLPVAGKAILYHILERLPKSISEIIIVIGHLGQKIVNAVGSSFEGRRVQYCEMYPLTGTAGALWSAQSFLTDHFLVLNGDDIVGLDDLRRLVTIPWAWGFQEQTTPQPGSWNLQIDNRGAVMGYTLMTNFGDKFPYRFSTGTFVLGTEIFRHEPVQMKNGEFGLPHTLIRRVHDLAFIAVPLRQWLPINTDAQLQASELALLKS